MIQAFAPLIDAMPMAVALLCEDTIVYGNAAFQTMTHCKVDQSRTECPGDLLEAITFARRQQKPLEFVSLELPGGHFHVQIDVKSLNVEGRACELVVLEDVSERYWELQRMALARKVFDANLDAIVVTDAHQHILAVNPAFTVVTGYTEDEVKSKTPKLLSSGLHDDRFYRRMWADIKEKGAWEGQIYNRRKNGEIYPEKLRITAIRDTSGEVKYYLAVFSDLSPLEDARKAIEKLTYQDSLTGLPNRAFFMEYLDTLLRDRAADARGKNLFVALLDLKGFRIINESEGHRIGDEVLRSAANRIRELVGRKGLVARLGGDEFGVVFSGDMTRKALEHLLDELIVAFARPMEVAGKRFILSLSVGVSAAEEGALQEREVLLRCTDLALAEAKHSPESRYAWCHNERIGHIQNYFELSQALRHVLEDDPAQIQGWLQPQVDLHSGRVVGAELLARWQRDGQWVAPPVFIELAEKHGLIKLLTERMFMIAFEAAHALDAAERSLRISVNISPLQLLQNDFSDWVEHQVRAAGLSPQHFTIEVTESAFVQVEEGPIQQLQQLCEAGFHISMDDFGTGYSSLSLLKKLPIQELKIDREFIRALPDDEEGRHMAEAILAMGHALGETLVAEGAETREQVDWLKAQGCDIVQGYYFGKPMPLQEFMAWLGEHDRIDDTV